MLFYIWFATKTHHYGYIERFFCQYKIIKEEVVHRRLCWSVFRVVSGMFTHRSSWQCRPKDKPVTMQKRLRNHWLSYIHTLPKLHTHTLLIDSSLVLIGVLFPGFIVFLQNEREWSVSVLTHVSQSFLLFRGNTVIETLLRSLSYGPEHFSLSLCCEKSHFTLKILYRDIRDCISRYRYTRWSQMRISRLLGGGF